MDGACGEGAAGGGFRGELLARGRGQRSLLAGTPGSSAPHLCAWGRSKPCAQHSHPQLPAR